MKYLIATIMLLVSSTSYSAEWYNGYVYVSNVCSNPYGYWVYPPNWAMPVGSFCRLPDGSPGRVGG